MDSLPPLVSAALEESGRSLLARLDRIAAHSPSSERYTILGEIARGGMGRIMRVWDNDLDRELAMKEIPSRAAADDEGSRADHERILARFIDEARITSQLGHPGIVPVHEIAVDAKGRLFFTMPLLRGETLAAVLAQVHREEGEWNRTRALNVLLNVCMTMAFAHNEGVVHRDLKPDNIMVGKYGEVHVVDWGLALIMGITEQQRVVGTPAYMSPEQARAEDVGPCSDVYSLGAILYELLTGRMPHALSLEQQPGTYESVLGSAPRPVSKAVYGVPGELVAICEKAMAPAPEDRYESAGAMAADLRAFLEDRVVEAFDSSRLARLRKWRTRNRKLSHALEAMVVLGLLSASIVFWIRWSGERQVLAEQRETIFNAYIKNIRASAGLLELGSVVEASLTLPEYDPDLAGWEWAHLAFALDSSTFALEAHEGSRFTHALYTPAADGFLTVSENRIMRLWDAQTRTIKQTYEGHENRITCVAFDPLGRHLASGDEENRVLLWDVDTATIVGELGAEKLNVTSLCFSPSGEQVIWSDEKGIYVHAVPDGALVADIPTVKGGHAVGIIPAEDEARITAVHADNTIRVWLIEDGTGRELRHVALAVSDRLTAAHNDAASLLAVSGMGDRVHLMNLGTLEDLWALPLGNSSPQALGFSRDGSRLVVGTNNQALETWDVVSRRLVCRQYGHDASINTIAFHPDGTRVLTSSMDGTVRFWTPEGGAELFVQSPGEWVFCLDFSPDGRTIRCGAADLDLGNPILCTWDAYTGEPLETLETPGVVDGIAYHPTEDRFAYLGNQGTTSKPSSIFVRRGDSAGESRELVGHAGFVRAIAYTADGTALLSRSHDRTIRRWEADREEAVELVAGIDEHSDSLATHPQANQFAYGTVDGAIHICDSSTGANLRTLPWGASIQSLDFSPDGRFLAAGTLEGKIVLWLLEASDPPVTLSDPDSLITSFAFAPDGSRIVSGSDTGSVRLWDVQRRELLLTLRGHSNQVRAVAFSPEGDRIASASIDGQVRLWRNSVRPRDERDD